MSLAVPAESRRPLPSHRQRPLLAGSIGRSPGALPVRQYACTCVLGKEFITSANVVPILNHHQPPVSPHFNQPGHSINDVHLIPLELMHSTRDSVRKAREAHLINKAKTLHPLGINRRDEAHQ